MAVLHNARTEIWKKPTMAKNAKDKTKMWEKAKSVRNSANPMTQAQIHRIPTRAFLTVASVKAAMVAPSPGADIKTPKPVGPTRNILVAKIGTNLL
jgi:hypothetical protein